MKKYSIYGTKVKFIKQNGKYAVVGAGRRLGIGRTKKKALQNARSMAYYDKERYFGSK